MNAMTAYPPIRLLDSFKVFKNKLRKGLGAINEKAKMRLSYRLLGHYSFCRFVSNADDNPPRL